MAIECADMLKDLINDYETFIQGGATSNVTLSDGFIMPSYQKFANSELLRPGVLWDNTMAYLRDDVISYGGNVYVAINDNINKQPDLNLDTWRLLETNLTQEGYGITGYASFLAKSGSLICSKNIDSLSYLGGSEYQITVKNEFAVTGELICTFGFSSEDISTSNLSRGKIFAVAARMTSNDGQTVNFVINRDQLLADHRIDFAFYTA